MGKIYKKYNRYQDPADVINHFNVAVDADTKPPAITFQSITGDVQMREVFERRVPYTTINNKDFDITGRLDTTYNSVVDAIGSDLNDEESKQMATYLLTRDSKNEPSSSIMTGIRCANIAVLDGMANVSDPLRKKMADKVYRGTLRIIENGEAPFNSITFNRYNHFSKVGGARKGRAQVIDLFCAGYREEGTLSRDQKELFENMSDFDTDDALSDDERAKNVETKQDRHEQFSKYPKTKQSLEIFRKFDYLKRRARIKRRSNRAIENVHRTVSILETPPKI